MVFAKTCKDAKLYEEDKKEAWGNPITRALDFWSHGSFNSVRRQLFPRKAEVSELYGSFISPYFARIPEGHLGTLVTEGGLYMARARPESVGCSSEQEGPVTFPARVEVKKFLPVEGQADYVKGPKNGVFTYDNFENLAEEELLLVHNLAEVFLRGRSEVSRDSFPELMAERGYPHAYVWDIGSDDGPKEDYFGVGFPSSREKIVADALLNGGHSKILFARNGILLHEGSPRSLGGFRGNPGQAAIASTWTCLSLVRIQSVLLIS